MNSLSLTLILLVHLIMLYLILILQQNFTLLVVVFWMMVMMEDGIPILHKSSPIQMMKMVQAIMTRVLPLNLNPTNVCLIPMEMLEELEAI